MATSKAALVDEMRPFMEQLIGTFSGIAAGRLKSYARDMVRCRTIAEASKIIDRQHSDLMAGAIAYAEQMEAEADELRAAASMSTAKLPDVEPSEADDDDD